MEALSTIAIVLIAYWIISPIVEWYSDWSAYRLPGPGQTKKERLEEIRRYENRVKSTEE